MQIIFNFIHKTVLKNASGLKIGTYQVVFAIMKQNNTFIKMLQKL